MYVQVAADGTVTVHEADDCRRLHLAVDGLDTEAAGAALRRAGTGELVDDGNARLDVAALRALAEPLATAPDWPQQWDAMLAYAATKGWLSPDARTVGVHVERPS
jgi:hypothetical protein